MKKHFFIALACLSLSMAAICQDSTKDAGTTDPAYTTKDSAAAPAPKEALSRDEKDRAAKSLKPADGQALVYILRPSTYGALIKMGVRLDGVHIGATKARTYVYTMMTPGKHTLMSTSENHATMDITVEAGKTYYVKQEVEMGMVIAETDMELLDEKQGLKYLGKCKIAKDNAATN